MATRQILLLQENVVVGGIHTSIKTLQDVLDRAGETCHTIAIRGSRIRDIVLAVARADLIVATNGFIPTYTAWLICTLLRKPAVYWLHGPTMDVLDQARASKGKRAWLRWLYRRLPRVVFVSHHAKESFLEFTGGANERQRLDIIPNTYPQWSVSRDPYSIHRLGFVGRLSPEKRPELLIRTLRLLPQSYCLDIVGDGVLYSAISAESKDLQNTRRVELVGFRPASAALYATWQATILTSRYEGCPMVALESLAAGRPCIALPIPAIKEMLATHMPYALAADFSAQALANAIKNVCSMPRDTLECDMTEVLKIYCPERFSENWLRVLRNASC